MSKLNKGRTFLVIAALFFASLSSASVITINPLNQRDPAGVMDTNTVTDWGRGWQFTVNTDDVWVTELGLITPSAGNYAIHLFDVATNASLASVSATGGPGSWQFHSIGPVALSNGNDYIVELYGIGTNQYYFGTSRIFQPSGDIDYGTMKFCNSCAPGTFPTRTLNDYNYGIPDIGYQIGAPNAVPAPATLALFGLGLAGLGWSRRKKS